LLGKAGGVLKVPHKTQAKKDAARTEAFKTKLPARLDAAAAEAGPGGCECSTSTAGLLPVIRRYWALKGVHVHVPYATRYQWGYRHAALEAEMNEARRAGKGERTDCRLGCRSGHCPRSW
jgi:hypothetical protein